MDELEAIVSRELPRPAVAVDVLLPYDRGDLVSRVHDEGDGVGQEHVAEGTRVRARVNAALAAELAPYAVSAAAASA
jgi:GTP-binding protein HflX